LQSRVLVGALVLILGQNVSAQRERNTAPSAPSPNQQGDYLFRWQDGNGAAREFLFVPDGKILPVIHAGFARAGSKLAS
jgi:hypothetical protein